MRSHTVSDSKSLISTTFGDVQRKRSDLARLSRFSALSWRVHEAWRNILRGLDALWLFSS